MALFAFARKLREILKLGADTENLVDELEDALVEADVGAATAAALCGELRRTQREKRQTSLADELRRLIAARLQSGEPPFEPDGLNVFLLLGVNGVGKTTTIAKLADYLRRTRGARGVVFAAGDTFRAGAIEQIRLHGERLGCRVVSQAPGSDPGAVIYDAVESAAARGDSLVLADTAGRLHNKTNLVRELQKIDRIVAGRAAHANYRKLLVIDATTGQNGLRQAEVFHEAVGIDGVVLSKYDSTARGGIVVAVCRELGLPISYVGCGEKVGDIRPFDIQEFLDRLLGNGQ